MYVGGRRWLQRTAAHRSAAQCTAAQCTAAQHSTAQHSAAQHSAAQLSPQRRQPRLQVVGRRGLHGLLLRRQGLPDRTHGVQILAHLARARRGISVRAVINGRETRGPGAPSTHPPTPLQARLVGHHLDEGVHLRQGCVREGETQGEGGVREGETHRESLDEGIHLLRRRGHARRRLHGVGHVLAANEA